MPPSICPACQRPLPKDDADAPARGKKWQRITIMMPEPEDKQALNDKIDILTQRYEAASGVRPSRFVMLDWALQELVDRDISPSEIGS